MMRKIFFVLIGIISTSVFSFDAATFTKCQQALPTDNPAFCSSFHEAATCYCKERKDRPFPEAYCSNTKWLYGIMVGTYGSLEKACEMQSETSKQNCIDNWNCYMKGGLDSNQRPCSSTKKACS